MTSFIVAAFKVSIRSMPMSAPTAGLSVQILWTPSFMIVDRLCSKMPATQPLNKSSHTWLPASTQAMRASLATDFHLSPAFTTLFSSSFGMTRLNSFTRVFAHLIGHDSFAMHRHSVQSNLSTMT